MNLVMVASKQDSNMCYITSARTEVDHY